MNSGDVGPNEMNEPHDFDGDGVGSIDHPPIDADTAALLADLRVAYTSIPPAPGDELIAYMTTTPEPAPTPSSQPRRSSPIRSALIAKASVALAALFAATGGLAAAHALPAPVQDAVSSLGIGRPAHDKAPHDVTTEVSTTTIPASTESTIDTPTSLPTEDSNHGADVSNIARTPSSDGCDHGATVSNVADQNANSSHDGNQPDGRSGSCETATTLPGAPPNASGEDTHGADNHSGDSSHGDGTGSSDTGGDTQSRDSNNGDQHDSPSTTIASTPTTQDRSGDNNSGSNDSGGGDSSPTTIDSGSSGSGSGSGN